MNELPSGASLSQGLQDRRHLLVSLEALLPKIEAVAERMRLSITRGGKTVWMGNGGSASHAQHMASEFIGRYARERGAWPAIALTADSAVLTAVANDYGFDRVFARQIEALCGPDDVVVGFTTSGTSPNVVQGLCAARAVGAYTIGLTGSRGVGLAEVCDECIALASDDAAHLQETHLVIAHMFCEALDANGRPHGA